MTRSVYDQGNIVFFIVEPFSRLDGDGQGESATGRGQGREPAQGGGELLICCGSPVFGHGFVVRLTELKASTVEAAVRVKAT